MSALFVILFMILSVIEGWGQTVESYAFTNINRVVPDGVASGIQDTRLIASSIYSIGEVTITVNLSGVDSGAYNGDLYVALQHASGLAVLLNRPGRTTANKYGYGDSGFAVQFKDAATNGDIHSYRLRVNANESTPISGSLTGTWQPDARNVDPSLTVSTNARSAFLSQFRGMSAQGAWTLLVIDLSPGGRAKLDSWSLNFTSVSPQPLYALTRLTNGPGGIVVSPDKNSFGASEAIQATAVAPAGYVFSGWGGASTGLTNPVGFTISSNSVLSATFSKVWGLALPSSANGTVSSSVSGTNFIDGSSVSLTAIAASGYAFTGWGGDASGSVNPLLVTMVTNKTISASFVPVYAISTAVLGGGSVLTAPSKATFVSGESVTLTAQPSAGWAFVGWSGASASVQSTITLVMDGPKSLTATFKRLWVLSGSVVGSGSITINPNQPTYLDGVSVTAVATPSLVYKFVGWAGDAASLTNSAVVLMNTNKAISAIFAPLITLNVVAASGGTVTTSPQLSDYTSNSVVTLTATPAAGYLFKGWTNDASGSGNPLLLTMDRSKTVQPVFVQGVTVSTSVVGAGTISIDPARSLYFPGDVISLVAQAGLGAAFTSWSGASVSTNSVLSLTLDTSKTVTANFVAQYALNTAIVGGGTVQTLPLKTNYLSGESVTLTAQPLAGWAFTGWSGSSSSTVSPLTLVVDGPKSLTATFQRLWTVTSSVVGSGTVTTSPNQASYLEGSVIKAVATPATGYKFTGWSGDVVGQTNSINLTVNTNKAMVASFAPLITLTVGSANGGTVAASPSQSDYASNAVVTLSANPSSGYLFKNWTGDAAGSSNPLLLTLDRSKTVQPVFVAGLTLSTNISGSGTVSVSPARNLYYPNETVTLVAQANPGSAFTGWSGAIVSTNALLNLTFDTNKTVTANFSAQYVLSTDSTGGGVVQTIPSKTNFLSGESVTLIALPSTGWAFTGWSGASTSNVSPLTFTMDSAKSMTGNFQRTWTVASAVTGLGSVTLNPNQSNYLDGSTLSATATPASGYKFVGWGGDGSGVTNTTSLVVNTNKTLLANFAPLITLNVLAANGGTATVSPQQSDYASNTVVTLTAIPSTGYLFKGWTNDVVSSVNPILLTMNQSKTLRPVFVQGLTLTTSIAGQGAVSVSPNRGLYYPNETVTLIAQPSSGFAFAGWSGASSSTNALLNLTLETNKTVTANFVAQFSLTAVAAGGGSVQIAPSKTNFLSGESVTLTALPLAGWAFTGWSGASSSTSPSLSLVMDASKSLTANFKRLWTVSSSVIGSGSVALNPGQQSYLDGSSVTILATPATGYKFVSWGGDASGLTNGATFVVNTNKALIANFAQLITLNVLAAAGGVVTTSPRQADYASNTVVTLTATPSTGYLFKGWSGDAVGSSNPLILTLNQSKTVQPVFIPGLTLTADSVGLGSITVSPLRPLYFPGDTVTLTAQPQTGAAFAFWTGASTSSISTISLTLDSSKAVTANFKVLRNLTVSTNGLGSIAYSPSALPQLDGSVVSIFATPGSGWMFKGWSGADKSTNNPLNITMDADKSLIANFIQEWPLTIPGSSGGSAVISPAVAKGYPDGSPVSLLATPSFGWVFAGWTGDLVSTNNPAVVIMDSAKVITPQFRRVYSVTLATDGDGTLNFPLGVTNVIEGTTIKLQATAGGGKRFAGWRGSVNSGYATASLTLTVSSDLNLTAVFLPIYSLTLIPDTNGVVNVTPLAPFGPKQERYFPGTNVTLTATPKPGYIFVDWSGTTNSTANPLSLTMITNQTIIPRFATGYVLDRTVIGDGTIMVFPEKQAYNPSEMVLIMCIPAVGSKFSWVSGSGAPADTNTSVFVVTMDGSKSVTSRFEGSHSITLNTNGLGSINIMPKQDQYFDGAVVTITAVPGGGNRFAGWTGSTNLGFATTSFTLTVSNNLSFTASFLPVYSLTVVPDANGSVGIAPLAPFGSKLEKYFPGTNVTLNATPRAGYQFKQWTVNGAVATANPITITMDSAKTVAPTFVLQAAAASLNSPLGVLVVSWSTNGNTVDLSVKNGSGESVIEVSSDLLEWKVLGGLSGVDSLKRQPQASVEFYRLAPDPTSYLAR